MNCPVTILLLDDEPILRAATALLLSRRGGRVTSAKSADEAVAFARERVYDVAVFDVSQPGPSAADVLRRIRAGGLPPRRVIAVSDGTIARREGDGFAEVLPRPYPFGSLVRAVFGGRRRTRSGVYRTVELTEQGPRGAARAGRGRGG